MSSDATRPNPGNVINRSNDEIPDYGRGAAHDNPDEMVRYTCSSYYTLIEVIN